MICLQMCKNRNKIWFIWHEIYRAIAVLFLFLLCFSYFHIWRTCWWRNRVAVDCLLVLLGILFLSQISLLFFSSFSFHSFIQVTRFTLIVYSTCRVNILHNQLETKSAETPFSQLSINTHANIFCIFIINCDCAVLSYNFLFFKLHLFFSMHGNQSGQQIKNLIVQCNLFPTWQ